jgi:type I restriction enzyme S subunit
MISTLCPDGVQYRPLWEVTYWDKRFNEVENFKQPKIMKYKYLLAAELKGLASNSGEIKLLTTNKSDLWTTSEITPFEAEEGEIVAIPWGGNPIVQYYKGKFLTADNRIAVARNPEELNVKFLYFVLSERMNEISEFYRGSGIKHPSMAKVLDLQIPIPPMLVQDEIVRILDTFKELETELEAELEARLKQRVQVIDWLQNGKMAQLEDAIEVPLSELVHFENGKPHEPLVDPLGDCELITSKFIASNGTLARRINLDDIRTHAYVDDIAIVLSDLPNGRALAKCYFVQRDSYYAVNQRIAILRSKDVTVADPEYLYHYVSRNPQILKFDDGSTQTHLKKANVVDLIVRLPALEIQVQIARALTALEKFVFGASDGLTAELRAHRQQYEYYLSKLLAFKEMEVA